MLLANSVTPDWSIHGLDAAIVLGYLAASFYYGVRASRVLHSERESEEDYFLAGRKVPAWANGTSYAVTLVNADVAPAYCGMAIVVGLPVAWFYMSRFALGLMLAAMLFAVRWRQLGVLTGPEFFSLRFGGRWAKAARIYTSLYSVSIGTIPWLGAGLLGIHMIFGPIVGIESKTVTLLLVVPVIVVYVWVSGYAGVIVTDILQTVVILVANVAVLVAVLVEFGGPTQLAAALHAALPEHAGEVLSLTPVPGHPVMGPLVVVAWMVVATIGIGGSVSLEGQRLFSCSSPREAAKVGVWGEAALFLMLVLLTIPTLGVLAHHPELYQAPPEVRERAYSLMLQEYLGPGLLGLALAALLASVMSTVAGHINYGSQTLVNDVCRQILPTFSDRQAVLIGRLLTLVILGLAVLVMSAADSLVGIAVVVTGLFGASLTFSWGQWWWWRANIWAWIASVIGGPVIYFLLDRVLPLWEWWSREAAVSPASAQGMAMLQAVLAMAVTTALWVFVAWATPPDSMSVLMQFYRRAQPMGAWGPVRAAILAADPAAALPPLRRGLILGGFGAALLGAAWIALAVLAISDAFVGRYAGAAGLAAAAAITALLFKAAFRWQMKRLGV